MEKNHAFANAVERNRTCQMTRYLRDLKGQVTEVIDALGQREQYAYDGKGQLLSKLDGKDAAVWVYGVSEGQGGWDILISINTFTKIK